MKAEKIVEVKRGVSGYLLTLITDSRRVVSFPNLKGVTRDILTHYPDNPEQLLRANIATAEKLLLGQTYLVWEE